MVAFTYLKLVHLDGLPEGFGLSKHKSVGAMYLQMQDVNLGFSQGNLRRNASVQVLVKERTFYLLKFHCLDCTETYCYSETW